MAYKSARWARKPSGHIFENGREVADTIQCCHCNAHIPFTGSSEVNICRNCMKPTCGKQKGDPCVPFERTLEIMEMGPVKWI
jgi:hypothetical protein